MQHLRSCTTLEVVPADEAFVYEAITTVYPFNFTDIRGEKIYYFVLLSTLLKSDQLDSIIKLARQWYCQYLAAKT